MKYIMESVHETHRLIEQEAAEATHLPLQRLRIEPGHRVLDAGCGPGLITRKLAEQVGPTGEVVAIDLSAPRLASAKGACDGVPQVNFAVADIRNTGLPDASFDRVWSQFVLEYVPDRTSALRELIRVTRSGGRIGVSEIDGLGLNNFPFPAEVEAGCRTLVEALAPTGFDLFVGRKLFSEFKLLGLKDVQVHVFPQYVVAGRADARMIEDWRIRFDTLEPAVVGHFGGRSAYRQFCDAYLALLEDENSLKYSVQLLTVGTRP